MPRYHKQDVVKGVLRACKVCGVIRPLEEFPHSRFFQGKEYKRNLCKTCYSDYMSAREVKANRSQTRYLKHKEAIAEYSKKYKGTHTQEDITRRKTNLAIKKGILKRKPCSVCDNIKSDAHHFDYNRPLEVIWLCRKHHRLLHGAQNSLIETERKEVLNDFVNWYVEQPKYWYDNNKTNWQRMMDAVQEYLPQQLTKECKHEHIVKNHSSGWVDGKAKHIKTKFCLDCCKEIGLWKDNFLSQQSTEGQQ